MTNAGVRKMDPFDFAGRSVFVAGGTSGINLGIAQAFAARGARLTVISRSPERVAAAVKSLEAEGAEALGFSADVREPAAVSAAFAGAHKAFGAIDVLISGAAGNFPAPALGMSPNGFKAVIDIDLIGTFNVLRTAHQFLRKPGASIINISAPQAMHATPLQAHVCAAKAGVDMLTRVLCLEWGSEGIRINSIIPGGISDTEGMARLAPTRKPKRRSAASCRSAASEPRRMSRTSPCFWPRRSPPTSPAPSFPWMAAARPMAIRAWDAC
jgi:NAD(P)-dependent dehydrogenase (short-subunit alcohol dehydrogenase family)